MARGLSLVDVTIRFGDLLILGEESFDVPTGRTLVVTGENGAGKSTLLYACAGLVGVTRGTVLLDGLKPDPEDPSALFRAGAPYIGVNFVGALESRLRELDAGDFF